MRSVLRSRIQLGMLSMVSLTLSALAGAEDPLRIEYHAPPGCPDADQFQRQVRHFLPKRDASRSENGSRLFQVEIAPDGRRGSLQLDQGGVRGVRQTEAETCEEVAQVLAFALALAIDPNARSPESEAASPPALDPAGSAPSPSSSPSPSPSSSDSLDPVSSALPGRSGRPAREPMSWGLALNGSVASALAPRITLGAGGSVEAFGWFGGQGLLRLGGTYSASASTSVEGASIDFENWLGLLEACPHVWRSGAVAFAACLRVESGVRTATARDIPGAHGSSRPWLSLGPSLHVRWRLLAPVFIDLGGGPAFPALRDHLFLRPAFTVHETPWVGFVGEMAIGVEFGDRTGN